jgi:hypothetical protein
VVSKDGATGVGVALRVAVCAQVDPQIMAQATSNICECLMTVTIGRA